MRDASEVADDNEKKKQEEGPEKLEGEEMTQDNPLYDESVFKSLLQTFPRRVVGSGILLLFSGSSFS